MNVTRKFRVGRWLPSDSEKIANHIRGIKAYVAKNPVSLDPAVTALNEYVTANPEVSQWSNDMFGEVNPKYDNTDYGREVGSWAECVPILNGILSMPSSFNDSGAVGFPVNALFDWAMGTQSGHKFFLDSGVNSRLMDVLNVWGTYLQSSESLCTVIIDNPPIDIYAGTFTDPQYNWLSDSAMVAMANALNDGTNYDGNPVAARQAYINSFACDPGTSSAPNAHYGYKSWDDFFTREFKPGIRPTPVGQDIVVNACESGPYRIAYNVARSADIYVKGQPYSLINIFNEKEGSSPLTDKYAGGTIYQAFLSAESYHRWHSPVSGTVINTYNTITQSPFDSTYYAEVLPDSPVDEDPAGPNESQAFIANAAARAIIEIKSSNTAIGDMCVVPIGMAECSTCDVTVQNASAVSKGGEVGMFHFGGSTHLLIFRPGTNLLFDFHGQRPGLDAGNIPINAQIAQVVDASISYPTAAGSSGMNIGSASQSNSAALLLVVPSATSTGQTPPFPINVGNAQGQYLWGIDLSGNVDTTRGTVQPSVTDAYANLHIDFPASGSSGYVIGDDPNSTVCAALKIVVPDGATNWPIVVANNAGTTIWGIDTTGKSQNSSTAATSSQTASLNIDYPHHEGGSNALMIGDVAMTLGCYGGVSIIVPENASSTVYAIAVVNSTGALLWGVDQGGHEISGAG